MASPEQGESAAGSPHSTPVPEEMDFDLFGPSSGSPSAQPPTTAAQVPGSGSAPTGAPVQLPVPPTPTLGADQLQQLMLQMLNNQNTALQQQQNQMNFLMQAQSAQLTLLNRRLGEEEARRKAEEARRTVSADPFAAASAGSGSGATVPAPTGSPVAPPSVPASVVTSGGSSSFGGRAEKYLPPLPLINHGEMKQGRIRELEEFHRFLEVLSSWLALTDDAFVGELRQCFVCAQRDPASEFAQRHRREECTAVLPAATGFGQVGQRIGDPQECFYSPGQRCSWLRRRARTVPSVLGEQPHGGGVHPR